MPNDSESPQEFREKLFAQIELGYDATASYMAAIKRLKALPLKVMFDEFRSEHMRHTYVLGRELKDLGIDPPSGLDIRPILERGPLAIRELDNDYEVLDVLQSIEGIMFESYSKLLLHRGAPARVLKTIRQNLEDEFRHGAWIRRELKIRTTSARELLTLEGSARPAELSVASEISSQWQPAALDEQSCQSGSTSARIR